jgi:hypothetical protein
MIVRSAILMAASFGIAGAAYADSFMPGAWSHETKTVSAEGTGYPQWLVKMFSNSSRKSCYTAQEAATRPEALLTQDDAATCKLRRFSMAGGVIVFDTFCTNKRFPDGLLIASKGHYTPTNYSLSTVSSGVKDGMQVKIVTTGSGKRTGTCR